MEGQLLSKLYDMGVLNAAAKLSDVENKLTVAAFCRRRLAVIMCMSKMAETVSAVRLSLFCRAPDVGRARACERYIELSLWTSHPRLACRKMSIRPSSS